MSSSLRNALKKYETKRNDNQKKQVNHLNFFMLPSTVRLPKYPVPKDLFSVIMHNLNSYDGMSEKSEKFLSILKKVKNGEMEINKGNHLQILKLMLYIEEIQNNLDMRRYDMNDRHIERVSQASEYFKIYVDGLMEERPSVRPNDIIEIRDPRRKVLYLLIVTNVMDDHIIGSAGERFRSQYSFENSYNIRFRAQNYTFRCCHYTLSLIHLYQLTPYLFPTKRPTFSNPSSYQTWFNKNIENNPEQKQAVLNIVGKSSKPAPYILYGPPGTGKTATLVEAICQIWQNNSSEHVLVCTASNAAADVITKRLLAHIPDNNIYRMYSPSKEGSQIDGDIISCSNYIDGQIMMLPKDIVKLKRIVICTLCASMRLLALEFREKHFSYVFIDEAGQATEPDSIIPFNLLSSMKEGRIGILHGQVIIAGDPQQLGPGIMSKIAEPILGKSMLERLMDMEPYKKNEHNKYNPSYITKLLRNYRSHPSIIQVSNELFYENELLACGDENIYKAEDWENLVKPKFPLIFHGVEGTEMKDRRSPSVYNIDEIKVVVMYVQLLVGKKLKRRIVTENDIGIVTPFTAQRQKLHKALEEKNYRNIDVGTVELFQGQEKEIIILTTVRTKKFFHDNRFHIGFLSNPKRFNVALTRAKALLIIVGNPLILQTDKYWRYLLNFCKRNNACRGVQYGLLEESSDLKYKRPILNRQEYGSSNLHDTNLDVVKIDDGILESSDDSMVDENEFTKPSANGKTFTNHYNTQTNSNTRSQYLLSDVDIKLLSDMKIDKQAAKKEKKRKKKIQTLEES